MPEISGEEILRMMQGQMPPNLKIPPPIYYELGGEILGFDPEAQTLRARYPVQARFQNVFGFLQGGMLVTVMDNVIGPLSLLLGVPSVTSSFNTQYLRPVTPEDEYLLVEARLVQRTRRMLHFHATVSNAAGKPVALGQAIQTVVEG